MEDIIAPISKDILKSELTEERRLRFTNKSHNEIYVVTAHNAPNVMKTIILTSCRKMCLKMSQIFLRTSKGGFTALSFSTENLVKIIKKFSLTKRRAANAQAARNSIISQFQQFVNRKFAQKLNKIFSRICAICLLHFPLG